MPGAFVSKETLTSASLCDTELLTALRCLAYRPPFLINLVETDTNRPCGGALLETQLLA